MQTFMKLLTFKILNGQVPNALPWEGIILLVTFSLRICLLLAAQPWNTEAFSEHAMYPDSRSYLDMTAGFLRGEIFDSVNLNRTPGYPAFIAAIFLFTSNSIIALILMQIILDTATVFLVMRTASMISKSRLVVSFSGVVYGLSIFAAAACGKILTESLFTFLFTLVMFFTIKTCTNLRSFNVVTLGLLLGLSTLVRPISLYYIVVLGVVLLLFANGSIGKKVRCLGILIVSTYIVLAPSMWINMNKYGQFRLSVMKEINLFEYEVPLSEHQATGEPFESVRERMRDQIGVHTDPLALAQSQRSYSLRYIVAHPSRYLKSHIRGTVNMFVGIEKGALLYESLGLDRKQDGSSDIYTIHEGIGQRFNRAISNMESEFFMTPLLGFKLISEYALLLIGIVYGMISQRTRIYTLVILMTLGYFVLAIGPVGYPRFKIPLIPLYSPLVALGLNFLVVNAKKLRAYPFRLSRFETSL